MSSPDAPPSMASTRSCMGGEPTDRSPGRSNGVGEPPCETPRRMRITHKVDYGVRAMVALARAERDRTRRARRSGSSWPRRRSIPGKFLDDILRLLRNAGLVRSHRGPGRRVDPGPPGRTEITVADVIRVLEGPLASVRGIRPDELAADGVAGAVRVPLGGRAGGAAVGARRGHAGRPRRGEAAEEGRQAPRRSRTPGPPAEGPSYFGT